MSNEAVVRQARVDAAGRPLTGRRRQALMSLSIIVSWFCMMMLIFWATKGHGPMMQGRFFLGIALVSWLCAEAIGGRRALVWPASALAIIGSLSLGFAAGLVTSVYRGPEVIGAVTVISGAASASMIAYLFRFRLPGLVSPIITFAIISLFLTIYGMDAEGLSQVEGLSPRGILAALIRDPVWMVLFGVLSAAAVVAARWLDLNGDDFGLASARPLHLIGAGVLALIVGRLLAKMPVPLPFLTLGALWLGAYLWSLRINRVAVLIAIHFAVAKPMISAIDEVVRINSLMAWHLDIYDWTYILVAIFVADLVLWYWLHKLSLMCGWTLGPGGRIPQPRKGWMWRYWPYA